MKLETVAKGITSLYRYLVEVPARMRYFELHAGLFGLMLLNVLKPDEAPSKCGEAVSRPRGNLSSRAGRY